ncbi:S4 domain protein YaaA [Clostridium cellulovorans 743B]|uniref:S4 domain protein YaaA n=2 Tax=Clostridium cellulovorans TaxID=1493 RepID=D9SMK9_CLOC7|nr:S4 domain protein YaaA [Clostridium cellulovorans 743B]
MIKIVNKESQHKYAEDIMSEIVIETEFIKLDSFMKLAAIVSSGSEAKMIIKSQEVTVNGEIEERRGKKLYKGDVVEFNGESYKVV